MTDLDGYATVEEYTRDNRETLVRILRHSDDPYARAVALTFLTRTYDAPELEQVKQELDAVAAG